MTDEDARARWQRITALHAEGSLDEAEQGYRELLAANPGHAAASHMLGMLLHQRGASDEAVRLLERALEISARNPAMLSNTVKALIELKRNSQAIGLLRNAAVEPAEIGETGLVFEIARAFQRKRAWVEAIEWLEEVLKRDPGHTGALLERGVAAGQLGDSGGAVALYRRLLEIQPGFHQAHSNLLIQLQYDPGVSAGDLFQAHRQWARQHGHPRPRPPADFPNDPTPGRPLRIGLISPRFDAGLVASFLPATLNAMRGESFRFHFYNTRRQAGEVLPALEPLGAWRTVDGLDDGELARQVEEDRIDIMVDLAGHNPGNRLVALSGRLAPVQMCWLDYYCTTGLDAMDYWLSDPHTSPAGSGRYFSERLVRLPTPRLVYTPPAAGIDPGRSDRPRGEITFGSFNRLGKLGDEVLALWAEILDAVGDARLVLKNMEFRDSRTRGHARARAAAAGIDPERVELRPPSDYMEMMAEYADVDIALDPFSFTGCATTCDALWMGVPVITLPGESAVSRQGCAILEAVGRPQWIATDRRGYANAAVELAGAIRHEGFDRAALRARVEASPLCDAAAQANALSAVFQEAWRDFCDDAASDPTTRN